jgi:hypothetical protein
VSDASSFRVGFGRAVINPEPGLSLAGYFEERPNTGVLDDICVKVCLIQSGDTLAGMIAYDLLVLPDAFMDRVRAALRKKGYPFAAKIPLCCTHTHTAPDLGGFFDPAEKYPEYQDFVVARTVEAVEVALADLAPAEVLAGSVMENPFAFNRRFWMKNGTVVTNPGTMNPDIVRPEGDVDREVAVMAVRRKGRIVGMVANISNHTDTTFGDKVSADWPGHMARGVQEKLGKDVHVITLIRPAGNVGHFNVFDTDQQLYGYDSSMEIGRTYARIVLDACDRALPVPGSGVTFVSRTVTIKKRKFTGAEIAEAKKLASMETGKAGGMTAQNLAKGDKAIEKFFARQLLKYIEWMPEEGRKFDMAALKFGREMGMVFLPGEPFNEIGVCIRMFSPCRTTLIASLANGAAGYVPYPECFKRGGYEPRPVVGGGPAEDTADLYIRTASELLNG